MLHLHRSHRLEDLVNALEAVLRVPSDDVFQPEWIVVEGRSTEQWLRAQLAQRLGVCANVRFLSPSSLTEEIVERALGVDREAVRAWRGERLTWAVLAALADTGLAESRAGEPLRRYLHGTTPGSARWVQLARNIAEHFRRYLVFRPSLVSGWGNAEGGDGADWQPMVWRLCRAHLSDAPHLADLLRRAQTAIDDGGALVGVPRRITWLVQGAAGELHLDAASLAARAGVDVHVLLPTASDSMLPGSPRPRHALLRSLARHTAGTEALVGRLLGEGATVRDARTHDDGPATMLARLQRDVVRDVARGPGGEAAHAILTTDGSIAVHVCHGRARQADVLRDVLLGLFDAHPDLMPRDVLVLTPDVDGFGPLVAAALSVQAPAAIPCRILDRPLRVENVVADAALRLLTLATGRVDAATMLDFIALPCVRDHFGLTEEDQRQLRQWAGESGVRWGVDADHRATFGVPADAEHTWRFGLDRLLLGWAMPSADGPLFAGALPYGEVEGQHAELLGRLAEACERTFAATAALTAARSIDRWCEALGTAMRTLLDPASTAVARLAFDAALRRLCEGRADTALTLDVAAFRLVLDATFAEPADAHDDGAGAVTLAALGPGRVLPARVVCLLGMDDGAFPRARSGGGFDLLNADRRPGDPDPNAEDRQSFLDAVLAARDHLVITYAGRSVATNERIAPAVPVTELLDTLDATFAVVDEAGGRGRLTRTLVEVEHALQPFSARNFDHHASSHDATHLAGAHALSRTRRVPPSFVTSAPLGRPAGERRVVPLDALAHFFVNPARALVTRRLGVSPHSEDTLEAREPAALDALDEHGLRDAVLRVMLGGGTLDDDDFLRARAGGRLPHSASGRLAFDDAHRDARRIVRAAAALLPGRVSEPLMIDHTLDAWQLVGRVGDRRSDGGLLQVQAGVPRARQLVGFWIRHLALHVVSGRGVTSTLVGMADSKGAGGAYELGPVSDAEAQLRVLLELFDHGHDAPLPFFPETSRAYANALRPDLEGEASARESALRDAQKKFLPSFGGAPAESEDVYVQRVFRDASVLDDPAFASTALAVWRPIAGRLGASR